MPSTANGGARADEAAARIFLHGDGSGELAARPADRKRAVRERTSQQRAFPHGDEAGGARGESGEPEGGRRQRRTNARRTG